jgi:hypothetical protein
MYSLYFTNKMRKVNYIQILKAHLWQVAVQVYHLQGEQCQFWKPIANDKLLFTIYRLKHLVSNSVSLDIVFQNGHCTPWWLYTCTCTTTCQRWYLYIINIVHLIGEIKGVYGCFGNWICFWLWVERGEHFFIHLVSLKGADINYWCSGCAWKKLWEWTVSKLMAMFIVLFCGNYGCDITGWLQINE